MSRFPHLRALALILALLALATAACGGDEAVDEAAPADAASPAPGDAGDAAAGDAAAGDAPTPAPDPAADARMVPELTVAEVAALADGEPASVRAVVWADGAGYWLCEALEASTPPSCAGPRLAVTDAGGLIAQLQVPLTVDGEVAWLSEPVVVWGYRRGADGFEPNPDAAGGDTPELSGSY